eukprot:8671181-Pyramimonas_sp.AAC.3
MVPHLDADDPVGRAHLRRQLELAGGVQVADRVGHQVPGVARLSQATMEGVRKGSGRGQEGVRRGSGGGLEGFPSCHQRPWPPHTTYSTRGTNRPQEARVYSHDEPIGRRKHGYILTGEADQRLE